VIQKRGSRWRVQVKHQGIVVADRTFDRKADAATWEREQKQQLLLGDYVPPPAGKQTVAVVATSFLEVRRVRSRSEPGSPTSLPCARTSCPGLVTSRSARSGGCTSSAS
jgi:hypothetical protein